jgi:hypothetical protein
MKLVYFGSLCTNYHKLALFDALFKVTHAFVDIFLHLLQVVDERE